MFFTKKIRGDIYLDPLIKPLSVDTGHGPEALATVHSGVYVISGLSNISFGLPCRRLINRAFAVMSLAAGMDAFILDPTDAQLMSLLRAADTLAGRDDFCMACITAERAGIWSIERISLPPVDKTWKS